MSAAEDRFQEQLREALAAAEEKPVPGPPRSELEQAAHDKRETRLTFVADFSAIVAVLIAMFVSTTLMMRMVASWRFASLDIEGTYVEHWGWITLGGVIAVIALVIVHVKVGEGRGLWGNYPRFR